MNAFVLLSLALLAGVVQGADPAYKSSEKPVSKYNPKTKFFEPVRCGKPTSGAYICYRLNIQMVPTQSNVTAGILTTFVGTLIDIPTKATVGEWSALNIKVGGDNGSARLVVNVLEFGPDLDDAIQVDGANEKRADGTNKDQDRIITGGNGRFTGAVGTFDYTGSIFAQPATIFANISLWVPQLPEMY